MPLINILKDGPILVHADNMKITIEGKDSDVAKEGVVALCRCGLSDMKPYCDGSHDADGGKSMPAAEIVVKKE
jgi:CDGSH-type Zn-finger protein